MTSTTFPRDFLMKFQTAFCRPFHLFLITKYYNMIILPMVNGFSIAEMVYWTRK